MIDLDPWGEIGVGWVIDERVDEVGDVESDIVEAIGVWEIAVGALTIESVVDEAFYSWMWSR